jgi:hypothetical protein
LIESSISADGRFWPDLSRSLDYVALDNPMRALPFVRECRKMLDNSLAFRAREDLAPGLRVAALWALLDLLPPHGHHRADRADLVLSINSNEGSR